jgi:putative transposase
MARLARVVAPNLPHHVIQRGVRSMAIFATDEDREGYVTLLAEFAGRYKLGIWAWCLMTNHVHLVVVPERKDSLARAVGEAHRRYTRRINLREAVRGHLFQERFHSFPIQADGHLLAVVRYVERNPMRAKMVVHAEDYSWSSARYHVAGRVDRLVKSSPIRGMVKDWRRFLRGDEARTEVDTIRQHVRTGRPWGATPWVKKLEGRLGRPLLPRIGGWPRGRSRKNQSQPQ